MSGQHFSCGSAWRKNTHAEQEAAYSDCGCFVCSRVHISLLNQQSFKDPTAGLVLRQKQGEDTGRKSNKRNHSVRLHSTTVLLFSTTMGLELKFFRIMWRRLQVWNMHWRDAVCPSLEIIRPMLFRMEVVCFLQDTNFSLCTSCWIAALAVSGLNLQQLCFAFNLPVQATCCVDLLALEILHLLMEQSR